MSYKVDYPNNTLSDWVSQFVRKSIFYNTALSLGFSGAVAQIRGAVGVGVGGSPPGEARAAKIF